MPTCKKCSSAFPNLMIVDGKERNLQRRKFCLTCSPFGLHNTRDIIDVVSIVEKFCKCCKTIKPLNHFYNIKKNKKISSYCKVCNKKNTLRRQNQFKLDCVMYKGGKCCICKYDKCIAALEFHHVDESTKEFIISRSWGKGITHRIKDELDKCDLLCANCHRETHYLQ